MANKWVVQKSVLENAIALIDNVPTRTGIKSSEFIKFSKGKKDAVYISMTSDLGGKAEVHAGAAFPFEQDLFLDRRLFIPFINKGREMKANEYYFIDKGDSVIVRHGNRKGHYGKAKEVLGYEDPIGLDTAKRIAINSKWASIVDCAESYASPDPITPQLNCVYLLQNEKNVEAMAYNQTAAFLGTVAVDKKIFTEGIAFPLLLIPALVFKGASRLIYTDKLAVVEYPKGRLWQAVKKDARLSFPYANIKKYVRKSLAAPTVASFPSLAFMKAVDRLSSYTSALSADDLALEIFIEKGSKKITLQAGPADSRFTELIQGNSIAKKETKVEWPLAMVMPVILYSKDAGNVDIHLDERGVSSFATKELTLVIAPRSK